VISISIITDEQINMRYLTWSKHHPFVLTLAHDVEVMLSERQMEELANKANWTLEDYCRWKETPDAIQKESKGRPN